MTFNKRSPGDAEDLGEARSASYRVNLERFQPEGFQVCDGRCG